MTKSWVLAASMLAASPVYAVPMQQDQESVQKEIEALKQKLADLEARLAKQEKAKEKMKEHHQEMMSKKDYANKSKRSRRMQSEEVADSGVQARLAKLEEKTEEKPNSPAEVELLLDSKNSSSLSS